jgi:hypothetical protein
MATPKPRTEVYLPNRPTEESYEDSLNLAEALFLLGYEVHVIVKTWTQARKMNKLMARNPNGSVDWSSPWVERITEE